MAEEKQNGVVAENGSAEEKHNGVVAENGSAEEKQNDVVAENGSAEEKHNGVVAENGSAEEKQNGVVVENGSAEVKQNGVVAENGSTPVVFVAMKPWLVVEAPKANDAVQFYKKAFGAEEVSRVNHPKRKADQELPLVLSAELKLGSVNFVVSDLIDDDSATVKSAVSGSLFCLETENVEAAVAKAVEAGAVSEGEIVEGEGPCCGDRVGKVKDPYGNVWVICESSKKSNGVAS